jgi:hypothetical protein
MWLLFDAVPQTQDRLNWKSTAHCSPFAAGQRTASIWLDTRQVRARQHGIDFSRQSNEHYLARQPRTIDTRLKACTVFARSEAGIMGSNRTQGMDVWGVCVCARARARFSVFVYRQRPCD